MSRIINKPWGYEEILEENEYYVVKAIHVENARLSLQYHREKVETLVWFSGDITVHIVDPEPRDIELSERDKVVHVPAKTIHRISGNGVILETSTPQLDDVVRIEDDYDRTVSTVSN